MLRAELSRGGPPMNSTTRLSKCCCCRASFEPDPRNRYHQKFCARDRCRRASKRASQRRWVNKAENRAYFCGPENVRRVQQWRKEHPGYSSKVRSASSGALQENCTSTTAGRTRGELTSAPVHAGPLQEVCRQELPLLVGLIARIKPCALQEDMAFHIQEVVMEGQCILDQLSGNRLCQPGSGHRQIELSFSRIV